MPLIIAIVILVGLYLSLRVSPEYKPSDFFPSARNFKDEPRFKKQPLNDDNAVFIGNQGVKRVFAPFDTAHVYVCGTTGCGKTVAISNFIDAGIKNDFPMLIVDGKGDVGDGSILDVVNRLKGNRKLYVINMNDPKSSERYNPFQNTSATMIKDMMISLTEWSEAHYQVNAERYLQRVIDLMVLNEESLSFKSIVGNMPISRYEELSAKLVKAEVITKDEHNANIEISKESGKIAQGSVARFASIIENELGGIFDDEGIDIFTALQEKAIILFILNPLSYPVLSTLIGNLVIIDAKKAVAKTFGDSLGRSFFIFDEVNVYISKNVLDLVNKSRSAKITCVLASQSLSDLEAVSPALKAGVIENCNNYLVMRQNYHENAEEWAKIIGTKGIVSMTYQIGADGGTGKGSARMVKEFIFHPDEIKNLNRGECFYIRKGDDGIKEKIFVHKPF
jgi:type IV secretory pathway TraG/TraD family ATPase VirD4